MIIIHSVMAHPEAATVIYIYMLPGIFNEKINLTKIGDYFEEVEDLDD